MPLFERKAEQDEELVGGADVATRALSATVVENDFVEGVYDKLAKVYDLFFGPTLHPGRLKAIQRMSIQADERVLEVHGISEPLTVPWRGGPSDPLVASARASLEAAVEQAYSPHQ